MENCELFDIKPYLLLKSKNKWFDLAQKVRQIINICRKEFDNKINEIYHVYMRSVDKIIIKET